MKTKHLIFLSIFFSFAIGYMSGASMDPIDRAIRKAQKINKNNLSGISSLREGGAFNLFGLFSKTSSLPEKLQNDSQFSNEYVTRISNNLEQKQQSVEILKETKEFIRLAKQEVFLDNSLQRYLVSLGRLQLENGLIYQAVSNLQQAYDLKPNDLSAIQLLSLAYLSLYQVLPEGSEKSSMGDSAIASLKATIKNSPNDINSIYGLALIYTDQGLYANALPLFLNILNKNPEHIDSLLGIARIYYDQGHSDKSRKIYEQTEALILELKNRRGFVRQKLNVSALDQKLTVIRKNLDIIYSSQDSSIGMP